MEKEHWKNNIFQLLFNLTDIKTAIAIRPLKYMRQDQNDWFVNQSLRIQWNLSTLSINISITCFEKVWKCTGSKTSWDTRVATTVFIRKETSIHNRKTFAVSQKEENTSSKNLSYPFYNFLSSILEYFKLNKPRCSSPFIRNVFQLFSILTKRIFSSSPSHMTRQKYLLLIYCSSRLLRFSEFLSCYLLYFRIFEYFYRFQPAV